jgi:integrase
LELEEYEQMRAAPDSAHLTEQQNRETGVATELMRWTGMRISDAHKFIDSEIVCNETGNGWNADFIQKKTKRRCVTPLPEHVVEMLQALPGQMKHGKKYFFTCRYSALRMRVDSLAERAQTDKKFTHAFSPHCLRHYATSRTMLPRRTESGFGPGQAGFCNAGWSLSGGIVREVWS